MTLEQPITVFTPSDEILGHSFSFWTGVWWQAYNYDDARRAVLPVFMLPGRIPEIGETISSRSFHIETNKPILIPIVNWYSFSIAEATERIDVVDQRTFSVLVDGFDVTNHCHRVSNPGFRLEGKLRELEAVEFGPDMLDKAVSDGYWLFIKTLPTGLTKMHTYGSCSSGATRIDMDYELEVL